MTGPQIGWLADGRLHLNHGPIDLILQAWGDADALRQGYARAVARFDGLLAELAAELPALRNPDAPVFGPVARVMADAVAPFRPDFITPMAAVAGAVAQTILAELAQPGVQRAYVNNGGDIALHLMPGQSLSAAIAARAGLPDRVSIRACDDVRGIATSGWRGRSFSFGIADAVTVLARTAAMADAAATMIANAVDLPGHGAILRRPAREIQADTDLGARAVTVAVGPLTPPEVRLALDRGARVANAARARDLIEGAALFLQGEVQTIGEILLTEASLA